MTAAILAVSTGVQATKVYKWVDELGNTHYGDSPQGNTPHEEIHVHKTPEIDPSVNTRKERTDRLIDSFAQERHEKKAEREAAAAEKKRRELACSEARETYAKYESSAFLYRKNEDGERVILNDDEYAEAMVKSQAEVDRWCD